MYKVDIGCKLPFTQGQAKMPTRAKFKFLFTQTPTSHIIYVPLMLSMASGMKKEFPKTASGYPKSHCKGCKLGNADFLLL